MFRALIECEFRRFFGGLKAYDRGSVLQKVPRFQLWALSAVVSPFIFHPRIDYGNLLNFYKQLDILFSEYGRKRSSQLDFGSRSFLKGILLSFLGVFFRMFLNDFSASKRSNKIRLSSLDEILFLPERFLKQFPFLLSTSRSYVLVEDSKHNCIRKYRGRKTSWVANWFVCHSAVRMMASLKSINESTHAIYKQLLQQIFQISQLTLVTPSTMTMTMTIKSNEFSTIFLKP